MGQKGFKLAIKDTIMQKIKSAGWFSVPEEARQTDLQIRRQHAIQGAISQLSNLQDDPQIAQVIAQLNTLMGP